MCEGCLGVAVAVYGRKSEKCSIRSVQACMGRRLVHQARRQSAYPWADSELNAGVPNPLPLQDFSAWLSSLCCY
jgi:hypothetical protein